MKKNKKNRNILLCITTILALFKSSMTVYFAFVLKNLLEYFSSGSQEEITLQVTTAIIFLLLFIGSEVLFGLFESKYIMLNSYELKTKAMSNILKMPVIEFNKVHSGAFMSLLTNDAKSVEDDYYGSIFDGISMAFSLIISICALLILNPVLGTISIVSSLLSLLVPMALSSILNKSRINLSKSQDSLTRKTKSILDGFETIKSYNVGSHVYDVYESEAASVKARNQSFKFMLNSTSAIGRGLGFFVFFIIIFTGLYLSVNNKITFGVLLASIQLSNNLVSPIISGVQTISRIRSTKQIKQKFDNIEPKGYSSNDLPFIDNFNESIALRDVSFSYDNQDSVLKNISVRFEKGKKYAIIGESGCGKSTLGKILLGIYDNYKGDVYIDGINTKQYSAGSMSKIIACINQNTFLIDGTIKENVMFYQKASEKSITSVLKQVKLAQLTDLKDSSTIGENGALLSGGEKQRISLARALIHDSPILLMDEATSQLDNENLQAIENIVLQSEQTVISITHRLVAEVLNNYDEIYVMANGQIKEQGSFSELMNAKGLLYSLYYIFAQNN